MFRRLRQWFSEWPGQPQGTNPVARPRTPVDGAKRKGVLERWYQRIQRTDEGK